jgi:hypothetical protein
MLNFNSVVSNILTEAISTPPWYKDIIDIFTKSTNIQVDSSVPPTDNDLRKTLQIAIKGETGNVSPQQIAISCLGLFDLFVQLTTTQWGANWKRGGTLTLENFISSVDANDPEIRTVLDNWKGNSNLQWNEYKPQTRNGSEVKRKAEKEIDTLGQAALRTYNNLSIVETIVQIVKKRTNFFDRIGNLKSLSQPFANLIKDIFKFPEQYSSGQKKVSSDYFNIVDNLYVTELFKIALYAKDFFESEIASKKMQLNQTNSQPTNPVPLTPTPTNPPPGAPPVPGTAPAPFRGRVGTYDSFNYFEKFVNDILLNEIGMIRTAAQSIGRGVQNVGKVITKKGRIAQLDPQTRKRYEEYKKRLKGDQANYDAFLSGKPIQYKTVDPTTGKETSEPLKTAGPYTIGIISKIDTDEARVLIQALQGLAQYTSNGVGAGERLRHAGSAMGAAAGFGGAKLYG